MKSPPGGGIVASPKRASSGPAIRKEARILEERSESSSVAATLAAQTRTELSAIQATSTPSCSSRASWASTSRIRGTLWRVTSSSVSRQAAMIGRAAFLLPAAVISPLSGTPPSMTNFSIEVPANRRVSGRGGRNGPSLSHERV